MHISAFKGICAKGSYDFQQLQSKNQHDVVAHIAADIQAGYLERDTRECLYLYEFVDGNKSTTSLIALMNNDMFTSQRIKVHEKTVTGEELAQAQLFQEFRLQINPVMLIFRNKKEIDQLLEKEKETSAPVIHLKAHAVEHRLYRVSDPEKIEGIVRLYHAISSFYLADGHHRLGAINRFGGSHFMAVLVANKDIHLHSFHKLIHLNAPVDKKDVLNKVRSQFGVRKLRNPPSDTCADVVIFFNNECYKIKPYREAEPLFVQQYLLKETFKDAQVQAVTPAQGIDYLSQAVASNRMVGIYQPRIQLEQILRMADGGFFVPPKSTYFEPKLPDGLISCDL